jgi:hypothetical protein
MKLLKKRKEKAYILMSWMMNYKGTNMEINSHLNGILGATQDFTVTTTGLLTGTTKEL